MIITAEAISQTYEKIKHAIIRTPTIEAPGLSIATDIELVLKLENLQHTSSFKARGAYNKMRSLTPEQKARGVTTMSAGNHAQAVAYHAKQMGIPATIVMPAQTPFAKVNRTRSWGAKVMLEGRNLNECEGAVNKLITEQGMTLIHPYNDEAVILGQGSVAIEMLADAPDLETLIVPIGGGGLISGMAIAAKAINPDIEIIGVQTALWPNMKAMIANQELAGGGETLAEGIAVKRPGDLTMPIVEALVDDILLVGEVYIERAVSMLVEQQRIVSEGAGAAGLAAILQHPERFKGKKCGLVICGGNIDPRLLAGVMTRCMAQDGRLVRLRIDITDEPGMLASISAAIGECGGNIVEIFHQRMFHDVPAKLAKIDAVIETRGADHVAEIIGSLEARGFTVATLEDT